MAKIPLLVLIYLGTLSREVLTVETCPSEKQTFLKVDPEGSRDDTSSTLRNGTTFQDLQAALKELNLITPTSREECFNVIVAAGNYVLNESITLSAINVILHGDRERTRVTVTAASALSGSSPPYALLFRNAVHVEISGIQFQSVSGGILVVEEVTTVIFKDCSFRWFAEGAVDIYQCFYVSISRCNFEHNGPVSRLRQGQYRGHGGGLSIGLNSKDSNTPSELLDTAGVEMRHCRFLNNTSEPLVLEEASSSAVEVLQRGVFPGRGGALAIIINSTFQFDVSIANCTFEDNYASSFGSAVAIALSGYSPHRITVDGLTFVNNDSPVTGALNMAYIEASGLGMPLEINISNSHFLRNKARFGAGYFFYSDRSTVGLDEESMQSIFNCTFVGNLATESGAAISLSSGLLFGTGSTLRKLPSFTLNECTFFANYGGTGGVVTVGYFPLVFRGRTNFTSNMGRVLVVLGTVVELAGELILANNDGRVVNGGSIYTTSFSQLELWPGANISFLDNTGIFGAALIVDNIVGGIPQSYRQVHNNPLCVLRYVNPTLLPDQWENVTFTFSGNEGLVGSSVLMNGLELCSFPNNELNRVFRWKFIKFSDNNNFAHAPNDSDSEWYVETAANNITISTDVTHAYPGELIAVKYTGFDELNRPTASSIRLSSNGTLAFTPSVATSKIISKANIKARFSVVEEYKSGKEYTMQVEALFTEVASEDLFNFTLKPCPPGYVLNQSLIEGTDRFSTLCLCNTDNNLNIRSCDGTQLTLKDGQWAAASYSNGTDSSFLFTFPCPDEYCHVQCSSDGKKTFCAPPYSINAQNEQCSCNRSGILCGDCTGNFGFSALLNKCVTCSFVNILYIAALVFLDIFVIGLLLMLKVGPPSWIYPTLFYVQVIPYLAQGFNKDFTLFQPYGLFFSSALSFYFAYDFCIKPYTDVIFVYFLRYIPFFITVAITLVVIIFRCVNKVLKRTPWYGLWWVILFQYVHLVHTSFTILYCPKLPNLEDGHQTPRWFINGNIECFTGYHIPLALLAILTLLFSVAIIPVIFFYSLDCIKKPVLLSLSIKPLSPWFKDNFSWWPAVELLRRLVFIGLIHVIVSEYPVAMFLGVYLTVQAFVQPYQQYLYNLLDMLLNVGALLLVIIRKETFTTVHYRNENHHHKDNTSTIVCQIKDAKISVGALFLHYLPVFVFLLCFVVAAIMTIKRKCWDQKHDDTSSTDDEFESVSYQLAAKPATSDFVESLPHNAVPLSATMFRLQPSRRERRTRKTRSHSRWSSHQSSWRAYTRYLRNRLRRRDSRMSADEVDEEVATALDSDMAMDRRRGEMMNSEGDILDGVRRQQQRQQKDSEQRQHRSQRMRRKEAGSGRSRWSSHFTITSHRYTQFLKRRRERKRSKPAQSEQEQSNHLEETIL